MSSLIKEIEILDSVAGNVAGSLNMNIEAGKFALMFAEFIQALKNKGFSGKMRAAESVKIIFALIDQINGEFQAGRKIACIKKCSVCCHSPVLCTTAEMELIAEFISTRSKDERKKIRANAKERIAQTAQFLADNPDSFFTSPLKQAKLTKEFQRGKSCMYLQMGSCLIYPARPIVCRVWRSEKRCLTIDDTKGIVKLYTDEIALDLIIKIDQAGKNTGRYPLSVWPLTEKFAGLF